MLKKVTKENLHWFTEKKLPIVFFNKDEYIIYNCLALLPDCDNAYLVAMNVNSGMPERLWRRGLTEDSAPYYYFENQIDLWSEVVKYHKNAIKDLEEWIAKEKEKEHRYIFEFREDPAALMHSREITKLAHKITIDGEVVKDRDFPIPN